MEPSQTIKLPSVICYSKILPNEVLALADARKDLRMLDLKVNRAISGLHIPNISSEHFGKHSKMLSVSHNMLFVAVTDVEAKVAYVYHIKKQQLLFDITWHRGLPEVLEFDPLNRYLASGGQDGKLCLWFSKNGKLAYTITSHQDFLSAIIFEPNGKLLASTSYDRKIMIINLYKMEVICTLGGKHPAVVNNLLFVPKSDFLISADRSGKVAKWDHKKGTFVQFILTISSQPTALALLKNDFVFVGGHSGIIAVYSIQADEIVSKSYIGVRDGIQRLFILDSTSELIIITHKKQIIKYQIFAREKELKGHIASRRFGAAYDIIRDNPIYKYFSDYKQLESIWSDSWQEAIHYLETENTTQAKEILEPFREVQEKSKMVTLLISNYKDFSKFKRAVETKNYQLAYSLLTKYPIYKDSHTYKVLENDWDERVTKSMKLIIANNSNLEEKLKLLFSDFKGISAKLIYIRDCYAQKNVLTIFNKYLNDKNYFGCFELIEKHPFLKDIKQYKDLELQEVTLLQQARGSLDAGNFQYAKDYASQLLAFPNYQEEARDILTHIDKTALFYTYVAQKSYAQMLNLVSKYPFLENLKEYNAFFELFNKFVKKSEDFLSNGNVEMILKTMKPFLDIKELSERIGKMLASAYIQQLYRLAKQQTPQNTIIKGINTYVNIFGIDDNLLFYITHLNDNLGINIIQSDSLEDRREELKPDYKKWSGSKMPLNIA